jgi:hypothetical protein
MAVLFLPAAAQAQATINVPRDQPTIQAGINAADDGDTVLVAPGKYVENIDFEGKAITVTSSGGATRTILDGGGTGPSVTFGSEETRTSVISGFTIQNGGGYGSNTTAIGIAGVLVSNSSPTVLNNTITQNQCWDVEILYGAPLIQGNTISSTVSPVGGCGTAGSGAGIYVGGNLDGDTESNDGSAAVIEGNTIESITIPALTASPGPTNRMDSNGGAAIAVYGGSPLIENNVLRNNSSPDGNGGAINVAGDPGTTIAQNLIYGNSAGCGGGAISYLPTSYGSNVNPGTFLTIANNTIVDNSGGSSTAYSSCGDASQIYSSNYGISSQQVVIVNNIISSSQPGAPAVSCEPLSLSGTPDEFSQSIFDHNLLYNAGGSFFDSTCVDVSAKYGNILAAPMFVNASADDYHIVPGSRGIDTGNNNSLQLIFQLSGTTLATDFDGNARVQDATGVGYPAIDIGAYESPGKVGGTTTVVLTASTYTGMSGAKLTLTAMLGSALGVPTGSAMFFLDGQQIGVAAIGAGGVARLATVIPSEGTHNLYVTYAGQGDFPPTRSIILLIDATGAQPSGTYATTLNVYSNVPQQTYGQDVTLTAIVSSADSNPAFVPSPITLTLNHVSVLTSLTPDKTGTARFTTKTLPGGADLITASYAGDATHQAATSNLTVDINPFPTGIVLVCSPVNILVGQTASLDVQVNSEAGTPTGPVIFSDDGVTFAEVDLANGMANVTYLGRSIGLHYIQALYVGAAGYQKGVAACYVPPVPPFTPPPYPPDVNVIGLPTTSVMTLNPSTGAFDTITNMTATVSPATPPGMGAPTGTVTFFNGTKTLGTANLAGGVAALSTVALPVGTNPVTCIYSGDSIYASSNCNTVPATRTIIQPTLTITASANNIPALTAVKFTVQMLANGPPPQGTTVVLTADGVVEPLTLNANGTATDSVSTLLPGADLITATFAGNANLLSASASLTETVVASQSATALSASPNPGYVGQPVTLTAMVTVPDTLVPIGGTVTFYDETAAIGTGTLDQARTATFTTSSLTVGTHALMASYPGTNVFLGSTAAEFDETILNSSFTIALSPTTITVPVDQKATVAVQLASIGSFAGPLTLSYGPLPTNTVASITPATVTLTAGGNGASTLLLNTFIAPTVATKQQGPRGIRRWPVVVLSALVLLLPRRKRLRREKQEERRTKGRLFLWLALLACVLQATIGCGNSFYTLPGAAPGTYQIQVTATDSNQHTQTAVLTLNVTPR